MVSKETILAYKPDLTPVEVPEWGGTVYVRVMSGTERDRYEQSAIRGQGKNSAINLIGVRGRLVALCLVDEKGTRLFSDKESEAVGELPANVLDRVFAAAQKANAFTKEDIEELEKNSEGDRNDSTGSGSPQCNTEA